MSEQRRSTIDRGDTVLVVIDIQERLAAAMSRREAVISATARLVGVAGVLGLPTLVTRQYPKGLGDTVPELAEILAGVDPIDKVCFRCGGEPAFEAALERTGRSQVIVCGMETHICVTQTALDLQARGLSVHVVADGVCSRSDADHEIALARLRAEGVVVTTSEAVMYEALGEAGTPEFKAVLAMVKERDATS